MWDKSNPLTYTLWNAPIISLAGLVSGFQEAFYKFQVRASWGRAPCGHASPCATMRVRAHKRRHHATMRMATRA
jgi:hypothetical protein